MIFNPYHPVHKNTGAKMAWQDTGVEVIGRSRLGQFVAGPAYSFHFHLDPSTRTAHDVLEYQFAFPTSPWARASTAEIEEQALLARTDFRFGNEDAAMAQIHRDAVVWREIEKQQEQRDAARAWEEHMKPTKCSGPCGSLDCAHGCMSGQKWTGSIYDSRRRGLFPSPGPIMMEEPWPKDLGLVESLCTGQGMVEPPRKRPGLVDSRRHEEQPSPVANAHPAIWPLVIGEMAQRDHLGQQRYGSRLQPHNGRDMMRDAYEEVLDLAVYLRGVIFERDGK